MRGPESIEPPKCLFFGHFWPDFFRFWEFKTQSASWDSCGIVWDSIPVAWDQFTPIWMRMVGPGSVKPPKYTPKCLFLGHFWPDFSQFWEFKTQNASWEGCGIVWDIVPVAWDQFTPIWMRASNPQNAYFWVISGQIFHDFGILNPKMPAGRAVE